MVTGTYSSSYSQPVTIYCVFRQTSTGFLFVFDDLDGGSRVAFLDAGGSPSSPYLFAGSSLLGTGGDMPVNTPSVAALVYNSASGTSAAYINRYGDLTPNSGPSITT